MTEKDVFDLYRDRFLPIYSDYVSLTAVKPQQILIEQENILAHLSQSQNPHLSEKFQKENLMKAHNHMLRVTLDMHKLVWAETKGKLDAFVLNDKKRLAFNLKESEVLQLYEQFINKARAARKFEMSNVGNNPIASIEPYEEVNTIGNQLLGQLDEIKAQTITHWGRIFTTKEFLFGVTASLIASIIFYCFTHPDLFS